MIITARQLEELKACPPAMAAFHAVVGEQTADVEWSETAQYLMLGDPTWRQWWGWAVSRRVIPAWSMHGADLREANLRETDLHGADLREANLRETDLSRADLREAKYCRHAILPDGFDPQAAGMILVEDWIELCHSNGGGKERRSR